MSKIFPNFRAPVHPDIEQRSGLQTSFMSSNATYANGVLGRKSPDAPEPLLGWTRNEQLADWAFYLASGSTGYLMLIVFGTTRECRIQVRHLWARFRGKSHVERGGDNGYVSFRSRGISAVCNTQTYSITPRTSERRRTPKPMTFVSSGVPLESSGERVEPFPPDSYKNIDLKTPRI